MGIGCRRNKKDPILIHIAYLKEAKSWELLDGFLSIILIDELEQGLHSLKQRMIIRKITQYIEDIKENTKMIISTHSPIIWKELLKIQREKPELIDIFYVLRSNEGYTKVLSRENLNTEFEKALEIELGLNIYDMPRTIIFCEGPTNREFLEGVFESRT